MGVGKDVEDEGGFAPFLRSRFEFAYYSEVRGGIQVTFRYHGAGSTGGTARYLLETGNYVIMKREFSR